MTDPQSGRDARAVRVGTAADGADAVVRGTLDKAAHENFPVAPFFLPRAWRDDLMAVYGFARLVDDIGDGDLAPGGGDARHLGVAPKEQSDPHDPGRTKAAETVAVADTAGGTDTADGTDRLVLLDAFEADLRKVFEPGGGQPSHPVLRRLVPTVRRHGIGPQPFLDLIAANRQDQLVKRYETYDDLLAYCELSANPVGRLVLAITRTSTPERVRLSDAVCTALQIVEHLQDVAEDLAQDRVYLPAEDMKRFHVQEEDLARATAGASVRALIAFEAERALDLLNEGTPLVGSVHGRLKLLLAGFVGGGRAAVRAIAAASYDVLPGPPKAGKGLLVREVGATLRGKG